MVLGYVEKRLRVLYLVPNEKEAEAQLVASVLVEIHAGAFREGCLSVKEQKQAVEAVDAIRSWARLIEAGSITLDEARALMVRDDYKVLIYQDEHGAWVFLENLLEAA